MDDLGLVGGVIKSPVKVCLYGPPGIGKTHMCAKIPNNVFLDLERGANNYDVFRRNASTLSEMLEFVKKFVEQKKFTTLTVDSWTVVEKFYINDVLKSNSWKNLEVPGYGKGYETLRQALSQYNEMEDFLVKNGKNIITICHQQVSIRTEPGHEPYDIIEPAVQKKYITQFCANKDAIIYLRPKLMVIEREKGDISIARGTGERIAELHTNAGIVCKTRKEGMAPQVINPTYEVMNLCLEN